MVFSLLMGGVKNAGDFLIAERCIQLLKHVYPECTFTIYFRNKDLSESLDSINQSDAVIMAGGPALAEDIYPKTIPLVQNLEDIRPPICTIGVGWYGKWTLDHAVYSAYKFNETTYQLVKRMDSDHVISCRDWYTVRMLKSHNICNTVMTGCPAWFDLENISVNGLRKTIHIPYRKICISDPGYSINIGRALHVAKYLRNTYSSAEITFVFHRGIAQDSYTTPQRAEKNQWLVEKLKQLGINSCDISYSAEGLKIYDDCDLHVGFRVHAHIYNISKHNVSVLIEEDARGSGVNEALGLYGVNPYHYRFSKLSGKIDLVENVFFLKNLEDALFMLEKNDFIMMKQAFSAEKLYFNVMVKYLEKIERIL